MCVIDTSLHVIDTSACVIISSFYLPAGSDLYRILLLSAISLIVGIISRGLIMKTAKIFFILTVLLLTVSLFTGTASANIGGSSGTFRIICNVENATVTLVSINDVTYDYGQIQNGYLDAEIYLFGTPFKQIIVDAGDPFDPVTYEITAYPEPGRTVEVTINFPVRDVWWTYDSTNTTLHISNNKTDDNYQRFTEADQIDQNIPWYDHRYECTKVVIEGSPAPAETTWWFCDFEYLREIKDLKNLDTSHVTNMGEMFRYCCELKALDLSSFNTSQVTDMYYMFENCQNLTELNLSSFDTSKVTDMSNMFDDCYKLEKLDVSSFNTSQVTDMDDMFEHCYNLTAVDVSSFNTSNVIRMNDMFKDCYELKTLDVSSFDTSQVTNMGEMFEDCRQLTELDLSSFNVSNVWNMEDMFYGCRELATIYVAPDTDWSGCEETYMMFDGCEKLVGGKGMTYDPDSTDGKYARVDGLDGSPGYFAVRLPACTIRADAGARGIISPSGNISVETGGKITFRMMPYAGWHISDVIVDGISVGAVSSYTFEAVDSDHTISVVYEADDTSTTVPKTTENLEKLIDHMVNNTPLDGNYDFNQDFRVNGKDVILLEMMIG